MRYAFFIEDGVDRGTLAHQRAADRRGQRLVVLAHGDGDRVVERRADSVAQRRRRRPPDRNRGPPCKIRRLRPPQNRKIDMPRGQIGDRPLRRAGRAEHRIADNIVGHAACGQRVSRRRGDQVVTDDGHADGKLRQPRIVERPQVIVAIGEAVDKDVPRPIIGLRRQHRLIARRHAEQRIAQVRRKCLAGESALQRLPDELQLQMQIVGDQPRDAIFEPALVAPGIRQPVGIGANSKHTLPRCVCPSGSGGHQEAGGDRRNLKEGERHKACRPWSCAP
jgi:hypothetical protein